MSAVIVKDAAREPFFTVVSLAGYLGVHPRTIRQWISDGKIPSYSFEGSRRISAADVDAYIRARRVA